MFRLRRGNLSADEATELTERLVDVTSVNLPLADGLLAAADDIANPRVRHGLTQLAERLEHGQSLDQALQTTDLRVPAYLPGLLQAGIRSGRLAEVLGELADHYRTSRDEWRQIWLALSYPCCLLLFLSIVTSVVLFWIVPDMNEIYQEFDADLPRMTQSLIWAKTGSYPPRGATKMKRQIRIGFTLVELLVVIAIIAILILTLLPAINAMRESARRSQCINNMSQLIIGIQGFNMSNGHFPSGVTDPAPGPIISQEQGFHHSWIIPLLPHIDEQNLYRAIDHEKSVYDKNNLPARETHVAVLTCPSAPGTLGPIAVSDYAGVHHNVEAPINSDNRGVLFLNSRITRDEVTDGAQYTFFLGEKVSPQRNEMGWMSGTRATLRNTGTPVNLTGPLATAKQVLSQDVINNYSSRTEYDDILGGDDGILEQGAVDESALGDESADNEDAGPSDAPQEDDSDEASQAERDASADQATDEANELDADTPNNQSDTPGGEGETPGDDADAPGDDVDAEVVDVDGTEASKLTDTQEPISPQDPWAAAKKAGLYVGGFGSHHLGGAVFALGDGHVKFITNEIDQQVYRNLGSRDDGQLIDSRLLD